MSRFGTDFTFIYTTQAGNWFVGTGVELDASQLPQYPVEESRKSDRQVIRNLNGDAYTYQNYNKQTLTFRWTYLQESKANEMKSMFDANPYIIFITNGTTYGTYILDGDPKISETLFEMYDIDVTLQEQ